LAAFERAGATSPTSFQVNGTVVFDSATDPQALAERVVQLLGPVCGYADAVLVRPVPWVLGLELDAVVANAEVSLFDAPAGFPEPLPWTPGRGGLTVVRADGRHAVSVNDLERTSGATSVLERLLGVPVTSRGVPTMVRLAAKLG
jgi:hypothetical protein